MIRIEYAASFEGPPTEENPRGVSIRPGHIDTVDSVEGERLIARGMAFEVDENGVTLRETPAERDRRRAADRLRDGRELTDEDRAALARAATRPSRDEAEEPTEEERQAMASMEADMLNQRQAQPERAVATPPVERATTQTPPPAPGAGKRGGKNAPAAPEA
jgi:hypothetical protein